MDGPGSRQGDEDDLLKDGFSPTERRQGVNGIGPPGTTTGPGRHEMLRTILKEKVRDSEGSPAFYTRLCILPSSKGSLVPPCRTGLLSKNHRLGKKRQTGGVDPLPRIQQNSDGRRNTDYGGGLERQEGRLEGNTSTPVRPSTTGNIVATHREPATSHVTGSTATPDTVHCDLNNTLQDIHNSVSQTGRYNFAGARIPLASQLNILEWRKRLAGYRDKTLGDYLQFGWPINFNRLSPLCNNDSNHPSAQCYGPDIEHYIATELRHRALFGPFTGPPVANFHVSPLMTKP